jgi:hypothetical protein
MNGKRHLKIKPTITLDPDTVKCLSKSQQVILWEMVHPPMFHIDLLSPTNCLDNSMVGEWCQI